MADRSGQQLGNYRLIRLVGKGGFAEVWRGYDLELRRAVAVKMPKQGRLPSTERFIAEAGEPAAEPVVPPPGEPDIAKLLRATAKYHKRMVGTPGNEEERR